MGPVSPDIEKYAFVSRYCLFAAISLLLKEEMAQYLPSIVEPMLEAVQSMEGITVSIFYVVKPVYHRVGYP